MCHWIINLKKKTEATVSEVFKTQPQRKSNPVELLCKTSESQCLSRRLPRYRNSRVYSSYTKPSVVIYPYRTTRIFPVITIRTTTCIDLSNNRHRIDIVERIDLLYRRIDYLWRSIFHTGISILYMCVCVCVSSSYKSVIFVTYTAHVSS